MSTLTLGIVVIIYMFILAWLGYIGYKQTKNLWNNLEKQEK